LGKGGAKAWLKGKPEVAYNLPVRKAFPEQRQNHFSRREKVLGQFMTPPSVARFMVRFFQSTFDQQQAIACDPACGEGVFLIALEEAGISGVGIDIDHLVVEGSRFKDRITIGDGLLFQPEETFDLVIGNPPFSSKYGRVSDRNLLDRFVLGRGRKSQAIEILFLEKFVRLAKPGGVIAIILPEGIFASLGLVYVRKWVLSVGGVLGVVSLPGNLFSRANVSVSVLFLKKGEAVQESFLGIADETDDLEQLLSDYQERRCGVKPWSGFAILDESTFLPRHFKDLGHTDGVPLWQFLSEARSGATRYGKERRFAGEGIPYIGAINITESGIDLGKRRLFVEPGSPMDIPGARVKAGDVLFVRVGAGCIGRAAVVPQELEGAIADDWIYILRPKPGVPPKWLADQFYTEPVRRFIATFKRGTGTPTIPKSVLLRMRLPEPPEIEVRL
jgi:type I restriction enzyme M protein